MSDKGPSTLLTLTSESAGEPDLEALHLIV